MPQGPLLGPLSFVIYISEHNIEADGNVCKFAGNKNIGSIMKSTLMRLEDCKKILTGFGGGIKYG